MHRIEENAAFPALAGLDVLQVCLGQYQAQIHLDGDTSIFLEGEFEYRAPDGSARSVQRGALIGQGLDRLVGTKVQTSSVSAGRLVITFSDGSGLSLGSDSDAYESFEIKRGCTTVVV